jgi:hypothetical protein
MKIHRGVSTDAKVKIGFIGSTEQVLEQQECDKRGEGYFSDGLPMVITHYNPDTGLLTSQYLTGEIQDK